MFQMQEYSDLNEVPFRKSYICDACPKEFETPSKLARHYLTHTGQKPFQCHDCTKSFRQLEHLERHKRTHIQPFLCSICQLNFKKQETLSKHQQKHHGFPSVEVRIGKKLPIDHQRNSAPAYCTRCHVVFATEEIRLLHQCNILNKKHKILRCEICDKVFASRSKLERHRLIHTGLKPFSCTVCGKAFRQKAHLKIHQITHTQERPFKCNQCFKTFKTSGNLLKHEEVHAQQEHSTNILNKSWESRAAPSPESGVFQTVKEESIEVFSVYVIPYQCPTCDQCFETQQIFDQHSCFITEDGKPLRRKFTRSRQRNRTGAQIDASKKVASGRFMKTEQFGESKLLKISNTVRQERATALEIPKPHPQQSARRHNTAESQRNLRDTELGICLQELLANGDADSTTGTFYGSDWKKPVNERNTLHHFLQGAKGVLIHRQINKCDQCEKAFPSLSKLRRHYLIHTGQKPFACSECGKQFRQSAHLKRHQVIHRKKVSVHRTKQTMGDLDQVPILEGRQVGFQYSQDPEDFDASVEYEVPEIKVEIEDPCDSASIQELPAMLHQRSRAIIPRDCAAKSRTGLFQRARRTWAVRRTYKCSVCTKIFLSPSKLERHYLIHAGQRPFQCPDCGKTFRQDPHLKRHQLIHIRVKV